MMTPQTPHAPDEARDHQLQALKAEIARLLDEQSRNLDRLHDDLARFLKVQREGIERFGRRIGA